MHLLQIVEGETRLKQQQNLYEAVRADRNLYSKNLIQAQDEIQEMKRKFQIMVCFLADHTAGSLSAKLPRSTLLGRSHVSVIKLCSCSSLWCYCTVRAAMP